MRNVYISGIGLTPVGEHWQSSLRDLALQAIQAAQRDAPGVKPEALFVGNMLAGELSHQEHLGALIADYAGMRGIEAVAVEAAGASGAAALRQAVLGVSSGLMNTALVVGVEKMTDKVGPGALAAATTATDSDWEAAQGVTPTALGALLMRRYMHEYQVELKDFAGFSVNAHANSKNNPNAMFHNSITAEAYLKAGMVSEPINMFDTAPEADGAAALIVSAAPDHAQVRVAASAIATDMLAVHDRPDPLGFEAARISAVKAYQLAGIGPQDVDLFELHDVFTVFAALSLEAAGFAERGQGWQLAQGAIALTGRIPISTLGGLKARGNPGGATGVYQSAEVVLQLRGAAGPTQVPEARWGMAQSIGGAGATAVTHIFQKTG